MSYGFTFNGRHSSEFGVIFRSRNRQLLPAPNDAYVQVPGRQGSILFPQELQDRVIALECDFVEGSLPDMRTMARQIAAWLYTADRATLAFDDEPGRFYRGKLQNAVDLEHLATMGQFSLVFRCEPLAYGEQFTVNFANDTATVFSPGTHEDWPVFDINVASATAEIKISKGTDYIRVVHGFKASDALHINTGTGAVLINSIPVMDKLDWQNSRWFSIDPGENNLTIAPTGKCTATVKFNPRWL